MAVRRPKKVNIGGQSFNVVFQPVVKLDDGQPVQGYMSSHEGVIKIRESQPFLDVDTLIHEIFHALEYKAGLEHNEYWVHRIATGFTQVLKDNPTVVKYIIERLKEDGNDRD